MTPSKELLSKVLSKEFDFMFGIYDVSTYDNLVQISFYETELCCMCGLHQINIYEFAHKCKEWALSKGYVLKSFITINGMAGCEMLELKTKNLLIHLGSLEQDAIFNACESILKESK